jgi:hypothetical protein
LRCLNVKCDLRGLHSQQSNPVASEQIVRGGPSGPAVQLDNRSIIGIGWKGARWRVESDKTGLVLGLTVRRWPLLLAQLPLSASEERSVVLFERQWSPRGWFPLCRRGMVCGEGIVNEGRREKEGIIEVALDVPSRALVGVGVVSTVRKLPPKVPTGRVESWLLCFRTLHHFLIHFNLSQRSRTSHHGAHRRHRNTGQAPSVQIAKTVRRDQHFQGRGRRRLFQDASEEGGQPHPGRYPT